jgi:hypothetical protein
MTTIEICGLGLAALVLLFLVLDTRRRRREQRQREQRRRDSAARAEVAEDTVPRGSDSCACGHDRVAHKHEVQHGWTVCTTKGCRCVLFVIAMQQRQDAPGDV